MSRRNKKTAFDGAGGGTGGDWPVNQQWCRRQEKKGFPVIDLEEVAVRRGERSILQKVSWRAKSGEHWAVLGANGSGKTSLLRLLAGYLFPAEGAVSVLGETFGATDLRELRSRLGLVSVYLKEWLERHHPEELALDVVASGFGAGIGRTAGGNRVEERAGETLAGLGGAALNRVPFGKLSQGQKQIVLIARALAPRPELLLLDEPCTGLDLAGRETLLASLDVANVHGELPTVIYVTHHPEEILPFFSHALLLRNGEVVSQGEKAKVLTADNLSAALGLPLEVVWRDGRIWAFVRRRS